MTRFAEINDRIDRKIARVCVLGLGYIGLPTALFYAEKGLQVIGLDTNDELVDNLRKGRIYMEEDGLEELANRNLPKIELFTSYEDITDIDVYVACLPSPVTREKTVVLRYIEDSISQIGKRADKGGLILIESTVPIGTTERLGKLFTEESGFEIDKDFWIAHCPERVLPSKVVEEMRKNPRLVGGATNQSTELAAIFLSSVYSEGLIHKTSSKVSEAAKLAENSFRDVNVAFANELACICAELQIDVTEVIKLANLHPRVNILNPGIGVGGYCLPKDGWLLVQSIREGSFIPVLIPAARDINDSMPNYVFKQIQRISNDTFSLKPAVGLLGLSFKANVSDTRNSPSIELVHLLLDAGIDVIVFDPYVDRDFGGKRASSLDEVLNQCNIIILGVAHDILLKDLKERDLSSKTIFDPNGSLHDFKAKIGTYHGTSV
ncbi:MAG: nucleotide sugar dehydrogenase [Candidatus Thorarchaeota archaeon]